jgi:hypothetical protein
MRRQRANQRPLDNQRQDRINQEPAPPTQSPGGQTNRIRRFNVRHEHLGGFFGADSIIACDNCKLTLLAMILPNLYDARRKNTGSLNSEPDKTFDGRL